jgi:hypothetical protein
MSWMVMGLVGCGSVDEGEGSFSKAPKFSLLDVNETSPSFGDRVSPRDAIGRVSVWYFGHAD